MISTYIPIIGPVLGGCIAAAAGLWLARWRWRRDGRDRFLAVLGELETELDDCEHVDSRTEVAHAASLDSLRSAVFAVQPFVSACRFQRLLALWHAYKKEDATGKGALIARTAHELKHGADSPDMPQYPDEMLRGYQKKFRKEVG